MKQPVLLITLNGDNSLKTHKNEVLAERDDTGQRKNVVDEYVCEECGSEASFGYGVSLLHERRGRWFCRQHRPRTEPNAWISRPGEDEAT
jgi:hypothetical protein